MGLMINLVERLYLSGNGVSRRLMFISSWIGVLYVNVRILGLATCGLLCLCPAHR